MKIRDRIQVGLARLVGRRYGSNPPQAFGLPAAEQEPGYLSQSGSASAADDEVRSRLDDWTPLEDEPHKEAPRSPIIDLRTMRPVSEPVAFHQLARDANATDLLLLGLRNHYFECVASGRIEQWRRSAHGIIDLVGDFEVHRRADLGTGFVSRSTN